jgi:Methyltransferase domain
MDRGILVPGRFERGMSTDQVGEPDDIRAPIHALAPDDWQMAPGERAAVEGLLAQICPAVAIEIGTAQGGSLRRIAHYSDEVHAFDLAPEVDRGEFPNVTFHVGDSHHLLPRVLEDLAREGRNVDFALVDGDHGPAGARHDLEALLRSPALRQSTIVMHDTMNEGVRGAFERIDWDAYGKVAFADLCFVQLDQSLSGLGERWGGLGLVLVDESRASACRVGIVRRRSGPGAHAVEIAWRLFAPLRAIARRAYRRAKDALARREAGAHR